MTEDNEARQVAKGRKFVRGMALASTALSISPPVKHEDSVVVREILENE